MSSASYATQEDPTFLWFEQSTFVSTHLSSVGYGIHLTIFSIVTYHVLKIRPKLWIFWLFFNTSLFAFGTINLACSIRYNENAWVTQRGYPGGPFNYLIEQQNHPVLTLGNSASILASFWADGLMLQRVMVLYQWNWWVIIPPTLFYIACIILSVLTTVQLALPTQTSWTPLSLPVWIVLMILPMWLSALIVGRILWHKKEVESSMGKEEAKIYTGIAAIVVESALPFTIISIILLGLFGDEDVAQNLFVSLMVQIECIAPEMIILRVIRGRAWSTRTLQRGKRKDAEEPENKLEVLSHMEFATRSRNSELLTGQLSSTAGGQSTSMFEDDSTRNGSQVQKS
ncbi:hypothetical protein WG66_007935 [Moniliophthora roreri]|uniref:Uncharacterized protein n=1 Tax=Moniliophthora roreri TaxID=221103 RepID=A0A0W0FTJ7_MONRR|nr:hypothetical protein WG66_007935 [Moniliophthora roreri]